MPKRILLRFDAPALFLGSIPVAFLRFITLAALGVVTIWLFSPPKSKHPFPSGSNRLEAVNASVGPTSAQADEVVGKPDSVTGQKEDGAAAPPQGRPPAGSPVEKSDRSQKGLVQLAGSSYRSSSTSNSARHVSEKGGKAILRNSRYKTFFQREVSNIKIRLISLWHRSGLSGAHYHKRLSSSH
jgi:hypothetical protein